MKLSKPMNRRTVLRSAGISVGLPLLEAMAPIGKTAFAQSQKPTRFMAVYAPCGFLQGKFLPKQNGTNYDMPETLKPLQRFKSDLLIPRNAFNTAQFHNGNGGAHAHGTGACLTAKKLELPKTNTRHGISVDQAIANGIGNQTPIKSLQLSAEELTRSDTSSCDTGWACAYIYHISWRADNHYNLNIADPQKAFDAIFRKVNATGSDALPKNQASVLDKVLSDITKLKTKLGATDKQKLDQYFTTIRELEEDLSASGNGGGGLAACSNKRDVGSASGANARAAQKRIDLMSDVCVLAFQCDATRVITHMFDRGASKRKFTDLFPDHSETHHHYSHHGNSVDKIKKLAQIEYWEMERFAYLLEKLKRTTDASGNNLLDSAMVYFTSEINEGDKHRYQNMPVIIAGSGNGFLKTGRAITLNNNKKEFGRLYETFITGMGINNYGRFGDFGGSGLNTDIIA